MNNMNNILYNQIQDKIYRNNYNNFVRNNKEIFKQKYFELIRKHNNKILYEIIENYKMVNNNHINNNNNNNNNAINFEIQRVLYQFNEDIKHYIN